MRWLHEHGLVSTYDDYAGLPVCVLEDARMLMEHEAQRAAKEMNAAERSQRAGIRG